MGALSPFHWLIVILVIIVVFGSSRIADMGKGLGEGMRAFKKGLFEDPPPEPGKTEPKKIPPSKDV